MDCAQAILDHAWRRRLEHDGACTELRSLEPDIFVFRCGEHHNGGPFTGLQTAQQTQTVAFTELQVEDHDVGLVPVDRIPAFCHRSARCEDLELRLGAKKLLQPRKHQRMVVHEDKVHRYGTSGSRKRHGNGQLRASLLR